MPLIETKGAASAQGFGLFAKTGGGDGTVGIFALGRRGDQSPQFSTTRNKYTYACCTSTASGVGAACSNSYSGSAAGNSTRGIFALGNTQAASGSSTTRNKYTYSTCTSTASGVGAASRRSQRGSAAGNATRGIFALGQVCAPSCCLYGVRTTTRNKYTYACCTSTASGVASASAASFDSSAAGNSTRGIFFLGCAFPVACYWVLVNKYTYACCTSTASGVAQATQRADGSAGTGNATRGIFQMSAGSNVRNKYTYSSCTNTASGVATSSSTVSDGPSAAGNSTRGIFALGCTGSLSNTRDKYTYSSCTSTACGVGVASAASGCGSAVSWATCVNS